MLTPKEIALLAAKALDSKKGLDIKVLETGHRGGIWILLDFSSVVVHIFNEEAREFYDLERLWSDATPVDLSGVLTEN